MSSFKTSDHKLLPMFQNMEILLVPVLIGKKRLSLFESQILKEGGALCVLNHVKKGQQHPTHIVVEDSLLREQVNLDKVLKPLGNVSGVVVGTRWLTDSIKLRKCMPAVDYQRSKQSSEEGDSSAGGFADCSPEKKPKLTGEGTSIDVALPQSGSQQNKQNKGEVEVNASIQITNIKTF